MSTFEKVLIAIALVMVVLVGYVAISPKSGSLSLGNVDSSFTYKTLTATNASTSANTAVPIKGGAGVLGSITISSPSATALSVYDGTSTTTGMQLIATLSATSTHGTYQFNADVLKGIVLLGSAGFNGVYTISYK